MNTAASSLRLAIAGDLALGGEFIAGHRPVGARLTYPLVPLAESLRDIDLFIVNLEGPVGIEGTPRKGRSVLLYNEPDVLDWLASFPNCICSLANNHAMDYGPEALQRTQQVLSARGIHAVGAGKNELEANEPLRLTVKDFKIGVLAFTTDETHVGSVLAGADSPGSSRLPDVEAACRRVRALAAEVDFVIVLLHWGYEYFSYPSPEQIELLRSVAKAGARLVVGHHPHVQQGYEQIGGNLICYSLGNLLLPEMRTSNGRIQYRKPVTKQFALLHANLNGNKMFEWRIEGGRCDRHYHLIPYPRDVAEGFEAHMNAISNNLQRLDYDEFWEGYSARRIEELRREQIREVISKLLAIDLKTLRKTCSWADLRRNISRVADIALGRGKKTVHY